MPTVHAQEGSLAQGKCSDWMESLILLFVYHYYWQNNSDIIITIIINNIDIINIVKEALSFST